MKSLFIFFIILCSATINVRGQNIGQSLSSSALAHSDSVLILDRDSLIQTLVKLVNERRHQQKESEQETADLLYLQWLIDKGAMPSKTNATKISQQPNEPSPVGNTQWEQINTRLRNIEQQLARQETLYSKVQQNWPLQQWQQIMAQQQLLIQLLANGISQASTTAKETIDIKGWKELQQQVEQLNARIAQQTIGKQASGTSHLIPIVSPMPGATSQSEPLQTQSTGSVAVADVRIIPADFHRAVYFRAASAQIPRQGNKAINETVFFLQSYPDVKIKLSGFASPDGSPTFNRRLARQRMQAVANRLIASGIDRKRLVVENGQIKSGALNHELARQVKISLIH